MGDALHAASEAAGYSAQSPLMSRLVRNERLTPSGHWQNVHLLELDIVGSALTHHPGDVLSMMPRNSEPAAREFCRTVGRCPESVLRLRPSEPKWSPCMPLYCRPIVDAAALGVAASDCLVTTLLEFACSSLDIQGTPRR
jgi:sulfite reductase alpha subunit-like flavoprotein